MTTIYFVRHAQPTAFNKLVSREEHEMRPLTEQGMKDSESIAQALRDIHIDRFICSPLTRSIQTIEPAAKEHGMDILIDDRLYERRGTLAGRGMEEMAKRWRDFSYCDEGGECLQSVQDRYIEALHDILELFDGKTLVVGTHGTAFAVMMNYFRKSWNSVKFATDVVKMMPAIYRVRFEGFNLVDCERIFAIERDYPKEIKA